MKKIITCSMLLIITTSSFGQQIKPSQSVSREDYLTKSKSQKSTAWILLGGGSALVATGFLIGNRKESSFDDAATGGIIGSIGVLSVIGSVPLFLASSRNKRKAMNASAYLKMERTQSIQQAVINFHSYPALSIKINL